MELALGAGVGGHTWRVEPQGKVPGVGKGSAGWRNKGTRCGWDRG